MVVPRGLHGTVGGDAVQTSVSSSGSGWLELIDLRSSPRAAWHMCRDVAETAESV